MRSSLSDRAKTVWNADRSFIQSFGLYSYSAISGETTVWNMPASAALPGSRSTLGKIYPDSGSGASCHRAFVIVYYSGHCLLSFIISFYLPWTLGAQKGGLVNARYAYLQFLHVVLIGIDPSTTRSSDLLVHSFRIPSFPLWWRWNWPKSPLNSFKVCMSRNLSHQLPLNVPPF
jgi:hypothetical protein